jgi:pimeloyl-ACP methyl ester carboxylesterase
VTNRKLVITTAVLVCGVGLATAAFLQAKRSGANAPSAARLSLKPCPLPGLDGEAFCGTYEVFENRATRSGRTIQLKIVVLKALGKSPAPDAIFTLHGGPGAPATGLIGLARGGILEPGRQDHDLVFVDQRGTGESNGLNCDVGDDPKDLAMFFGEILPRDRVRACREKLESKADLRLYTTPIAMDDLDDVRAALGYDKIDVVGISYGTFAAQIYMRQHPEHVRSVFLVGVATPSIKQPLLFPRSAQHAMDLLFTDCAADAQCRSTFPDLQKEFASLLARFDQGPLSLDLINPVTKKKEQVRVFRSSFVENLRLAMYSTNTQRFVPFIIHRAFANDYLPFEEAALRVNPGGGVARGMYFTVTCSEGVPFITDQDIVEQTRGTYVGPDRVKLHKAACQEWPRGDIPSNYIDPVKSDLPVLMISGEVDGSSPPWFAEDAMKFLRNGRRLKIRYLGHQVDGPCLRDIFRDFVAAGSAKDLDTSCTEQIRRPPFAMELPPGFALN